MSKYKIGDKLKVREDLKCGDIYNDVLVSHSMETLAGKVVTILTINDEDENDILFTIKECRDQDFSWSELMFEKEDILTEEEIRYYKRHTFKVNSDYREGFANGFEYAVKIIQDKLRRK